ncbi:MAG: tetratricopeptide repeat protein [Acidobacteriota bacterium]
MKRCPECNRVETDEALKFCRVDGATLVSDSSSIDQEAGTVKLGSGSVANEPTTGSLLQTTDVNINRATAPTTVLPPQSVSSTTSEFRITTKRRLNPKALAVIGIAIVAVVAAVVFISYRSRSRSAAIESIAVMPFVNESGNADVEYLSDGMTETLIGSLSQLPNLNVKARSTVFRYKGKAMDAKAVGKELNVQAVLNGRVMQRGDQLTLSLELVNADTENVIWTEQYNRKQADLVSLQSEIARDVSSKLKSKLSSADQAKMAKTYTSDPEAYRLYLQGQFYLNKRVGKLFDRAEDYFKQAIERDPNFALGYVGLAVFIGQRDRPKAKEYIMRALALDNQLSDAHSALGYQLMLDYDFAACERELKRAIELDPNNAWAYQTNGSRLTMLGLYDEALASYDRAIELEPTLADMRNNRAGCLVASGKIDAGIEELKKGMQLDPEFAWTHSHISFIYRMKGERAASVEERARACDLLDQPENAKALRETFAKSGWTAYLRELLRQDWGKLGTSQTRRASLLAELNEKEEAFAALNIAAEKGDFWLFSIKYDPAFDGLRGDPRFQELLKKFDPPQ